MAIYAIGDLHLSFGSSKPMNIFGPEWDGHPEKIEKNWNDLVSEDDLVILAGDISWAMQLQEVEADLNWLSGLKGSKLLVRGNHDYWWSSIGKVRAMLPPGIFALQNDHFTWGGCLICGTRGWLCPGEDGFNSDQDQKLYHREVQRLQLSLESTAGKTGMPIITAMHFPPFNRQGQPSAFTALMEEYGVKICLFGHIHDDGRDYIFQGERKGIRYIFVAADGINFTPKKIVI